MKRKKARKAYSPKVRSGKMRVVAGKRITAVSSPESRRKGLVLQVFGVGPWIKPEIEFKEAGLPRGKGTERVLARGQKIFEEKGKRLEAAGKPRPRLFENPAISKQHIRVKGKGIKFETGAGGYVPYTFSKEALLKLPPKERRTLLRSGELDKRFPHILPAGAGVLSIGKKWIIIPKRSATVATYPNMYHVVSGMASVYPHAETKRKHETPVETATREVAEEIGFKHPGKVKQLPWFAAEKLAREIGLAKRQFQFLGADFKPVKAENAKALTIVRDVKNATIEPLFAVNIKTKNPDKMIKDKFIEKADGTLEVRQAEDKWEMQHAVKIRMNPQAIREFIKEHRHEITPNALVALTTFAEELENRRRKRNR